MIYFYVGLGGVAGSLFRFFLTVIAVEIWGREFPIGTLVINLTGSFLLGWLSNHFISSKKLHPYLFTALTSGFIGSYTTFSTFCYETVHLFESGEYIVGFFYLFVSLYGGLFFVTAGMNLSEKGKKSRRVL